MAESSVCTVNAQLTSQELNIPYWRIDSGVPGPTLLIMASQHGHEVQGAEVIRRPLPALKGSSAGCVLMVPFANLLALQNRRPHANSGPETPMAIRALKTSTEHGPAVPTAPTANGSLMP